MSTASTQAAMPAQRYRPPQPWVRWLTVVTVVALALSGSGWLLWAALYHSSPQVASRLLGFRVVGAHRVDVVVQVQRRTEVAATCRVVAQAADHGVVGDLTFGVPAEGASTVTLSRAVPTERTAVAAVLEGCTTAEQPMPR